MRGIGSRLFFREHRKNPVSGTHRPEGTPAGCCNKRSDSDEVLKADFVPPFFGEILGHQPSMAVFGPVFAAEQTTFVQDFGGYGFFYFSFLHQLSEFFLVGRPVSFSLFVGDEYVFCRGQFGKVDVIYVSRLNQGLRWL